MTIDSGVGRGRRTARGQGIPWLAALAFAACASPDGGDSGDAALGAEGVADLVILGGRVMDPETRLDAVRDVAVADGRITAIAEGGVAGRDTIDAAGLVVAPGFVDLHAHGQDTVSAKLQGARRRDDGPRDGTRRVPGGRMGRLPAKGRRPSTSGRR